MSEALLGSELNDMVNRYLEELAGALQRLPLSRRDHLISEIREHITQMRSERPVRDRSDMEALLNRVGLPEDIAAVALEGEEIEEPAEPVATAKVVTPGLWTVAREKVSKRVVLAGAAAAVLLVGLVIGLAAAGRHSSQAVMGRVEPSGVPEVPSLAPLPGQVRVVVPNVIGESEAAAVATLAAADLSYNLVNSASATTPVGLVISQTPPPGLSTDRRPSVTITVSTGPAATTS